MAFAIDVNINAYWDQPPSSDLRQARGQLPGLVATEPEVARRPRRAQTPGASGKVGVAAIGPIRKLERGLAHMSRVEMMTDLVTSLAHEITEPIAAVELGAEACLRWIEHDPIAVDEVRQILLRIVKDARRAANIVERNRSLYSEDATCDRG